MTDYFLLLGQPRRPWLDPEELKEKFHSLTAVHHPDLAKADAIDFTLLNAAYNVLRDPRSRLSHLLELEGHRPATHSQVPADLSDQFMAIGALLYRAKQLENQITAASSPLAAALLAPAKFELLEELENALGLQTQQQVASLELLQQIDAEWETQRPLGALAVLAERLAYIKRWEDQLRETISRLAF